MELCETKTQHTFDPSALSTQGETKLASMKNTVQMPALKYGYYVIFEITEALPKESSVRS